MTEFDNFYRMEQLLDIVLCQEGTTQYSHDFTNTSVEIKRSFDNGNSTISDNSHINLYPYSIFSISPEGFNAQVSLHPFKETLHDPSIFIKKGYFPGFKIKVVRVVSKGSFEFRFIIDYSPDLGRVIFRVPLGGEPYGTISEDIFR